MDGMKIYNKVERVGKTNEVKTLQTFADHVKEKVI